MGKGVALSVYVAVNSVDLTDHVKGVNFSYEGEPVDITAMGDLFRKNIGGLKNWKCDVEFLLDEATSSVNQTIFPLIGGTTTLEVRPTNASVGAANPKYTGTAFVQSMPVVNGNVGEAMAGTVSFMSAGTLSRAIS